MATRSPDKTDVYQRITDKFIELLESGVKPWERPWSSTGEGKLLFPQRATGQHYQGINILLLWDAIERNGFTHPMFMTFKQAEAEGAHVRKGEKGTTVVFANTLNRTETNEKTGEDEDVSIPYMKAYTVFNVAQIEGLPDKYHPAPAAEPTEKTRFELLEEAEQFFADTGATFLHGGAKAFYAPSRDIIQLPDPHDFNDAESYAATKAHELQHWTGAESRCNRTFGKRFGDDAYAMEELTAEIGAAFLGAQLGVKPDHLESHASYVDHWLKVLKSDKRAIFTASSAAQKSTQFLHDLVAANRHPSLADELDAEQENDHRPQPVAGPSI